MIRRIFVSVFFSLAVVSFTFSQTPTPTPELPAETEPVSTPTPQAETLTTPIPQATPAASKQARPDALGSNAPYVRPDSKTRFKRYIRGMAGPMTLGKSVVYSGIGTWRDSPEEWGNNWEGFGRRVASGLGTNAIKQTITYGLGEAFELDSSYYRSQKKDFGSKVKNALISPVTARNKEGKRVFGYPRIVGIYSAHFIAREAWYPERYHWYDGFKSASTSLAFSAGYNLIKEFIWKK